MIDGYEADKEFLANKIELRQMLDSVPRLMGMHTISEPLVVEVGEKNRKDPGGISGFVMIAESHISFHTFPMRGFVTIDVYTCQNDLDTQALVNHFTDAFKIKRSDVYVQNRGLTYPAENIY